MKLNRIDYGEQPPINAYGDGGFRFAGRRHEGSLLILPDAVRHWPVTETVGLSAEDLDSVIEIASQIDLLLIGTGKAIARPPSAVIAALEEQGIGAEFMDTGAACRTYNVLLAEQRRIAAALIAVE